MFLLLFTFATGEDEVVLPVALLWSCCSSFPCSSSTEPDGLFTISSPLVSFPGSCNDSCSSEVELLVLLVFTTGEDEVVLPVALLCADSCSSEVELLVLLAFTTGEDEVVLPVALLCDDSCSSEVEVLVLLAFATGEDEVVLPVTLL